MSIELTIKYSNTEYKSAIKEKLAVMPNKSLHTYLPTAFFILILFALTYYDAAHSWWGISIIVLLSIYAIPCLFGDWIMPKIALAFAKKKKLQDTYHFTITENHIERRSEKGLLISTKWEELVSVEFLPQNIFFNLEKGSMLIPNSRLTDEELEKLKTYAERT